MYVQLGKLANSTDRWLLWEITLALASTRELLASWSSPPLILKRRSGVKWSNRSAARRLRMESYRRRELMPIIRSSLCFRILISKTLKWTETLRIVLCTFGIVFSGFTRKRLSILANPLSHMLLLASAQVSIGLEWTRAT